MIIDYYFLFLKTKIKNGSVFKQALNSFLIFIKHKITKFKSFNYKLLLNDINMTYHLMYSTSFLPLMKDVAWSLDGGVDHVNQLDLRARNGYFNSAVARDTFLFTFRQKRI